jgi:RNA polymerase subunit RPABC4/transcription elongation factor Spt4
LTSSTPRFKACPRCGRPARIDAPHCTQCGALYVPEAGPDDRTQVRGPSLQPVPAIPAVTPSQRPTKACRNCYELIDARALCCPFCTRQTMRGALRAFGLRIGRLLVAGVVVTAALISLCRMALLAVDSGVRRASAELGIPAVSSPRAIAGPGARLPVHHHRRHRHAAR